jgi:hypothetical protein
MQQKETIKKYNVIVGKAYIEIHKGQQREFFYKELEIPTEVAMKDIIGDGLAKVSMTLEKSDKVYGNGISASVTVTLTINQSEDAIAEAMNQLRLVVVEELRLAYEDTKSLC